MQQNGVKFMHHPRFGYLCACPSNIGTGLRCSAHVRLEHLSQVICSYLLDLNLTLDLLKCLLILLHSFEAGIAKAIGSFK